LPLISSTPRRRIMLRCFIRDQFVRPLMTPIDCNHHSKAVGKLTKNRRLCLSAPNDAALNIVGAVEPEETGAPGPTPQSYTRSRGVCRRSRNGIASSHYSNIIDAPYVGL
jgi:hypothetical protein